MSFQVLCHNCRDFKEFNFDETISTNRIHVFRCKECNKIIVIEIFDEFGESEVSITLD